jgi:hypothetical protein
MQILWLIDLNVKYKTSNNKKKLLQENITENPCALGLDDELLYTTQKAYHTKKKNQ